ncbi:unnamed protein product [Spodoptera exigua]|nr:unnamed protein product [Spodoptera exigua]
MLGLKLNKVCTSEPVLNPASKIQVGKRANVLPDGKQSASPMDTRNDECVVDLLGIRDLEILGKETWNVNAGRGGAARGAPVGGVLGGRASAHGGEVAVRAATRDTAHL